MEIPEGVWLQSWETQCGSTSSLTRRDMCLFFLTPKQKSILTGAPAGGSVDQPWSTMATNFGIVCTCSFFERKWDM